MLVLKCGACIESRQIDAKDVKLEREVSQFSDGCYAVSELLSTVECSRKRICPLGHAGTLRLDCIAKVI